VSRRLVTVLLVAGVLALVGASLVLGGGSEFLGTDNQAVTAIQEQDPGYEPWFTSVLPPLSPSGCSRPRRRWAAASSGT
jgi:cobalt/nickel transport protein